MKRLQDILVEATKKDKAVVFTFGRFQPPTIGHQKLIEKVKSVARKEGAEHRIYPSRSHDAKKNPLKPRDKVKYMRKLFPGANIVDDNSMKTAFHVLKQLSNDGYKTVILVVGGDRVKDFESQVRKYIHHPDKKKSFEFDDFRVVSAGERDPDATDVTGMSASKMRAAVSENDYNTFKLGIPPGTNEKVIKSLFSDLKKSMGVKESLESDWNMLTLLEEKKENKPTVLVLTKASDELSETGEKIKSASEKLGMSFFAVHTDHAFIVDKDMTDDNITIHNYDGNNKKINLVTDNTICFIRGGAMVNYAGMGLAKILEDSGVFTVNRVSRMEFCQNKFITALALERNNILSPRTSLVNSEDSIDVSLEKVGDYGCRRYRRFQSRFIRFIKISFTIFMEI